MDYRKDEVSKDKKTRESEVKIAELTSGWQRTQADFANYKRQAEVDKTRFVKLANQDLMLEVLPVLDNFQLAAKHVPAELESNNWAIGVKQIEKQLESILESEGLKKIAAIGSEFNPHFHEAIEHLRSDKPEGEIVEEIVPGYTFDDIVIRPAKVKVSSGKK